MGVCVKGGKGDGRTGARCAPLLLALLAVLTAVSSGL